MEGTIYNETVELDYIVVSDGAVEEQLVEFIEIIVDESDTDCCCIEYTAEETELTGLEVVITTETEV